MIIINIPCTITNKKAVIPREYIAVCGNSDYVIRFSFDSEWANFGTKTARFEYNGGYTDVVFSGNDCAMPIIQNAPFVEIGVFAGNLHTTTPALLMMQKSILCDGGTPITPTPSVYAQIMTLLNALDDSMGDLTELETEAKNNLVAAINEIFESGGGTDDHTQLTNRDAAEQHPMSAITGLVAALAAKGTYSKPSGGIPSTDLASAVQTSLEKADSALQEHQSLSAYRTSSAQDVIDNAITDDIDAIEGKIPAQATAENQLADKGFVNSSIGTNTAYYISNNGQPFTSVAQLEAYSGTVTNNDYAFVTGVDESGNTYFDRYKATVSGSTVTWAKEYRLNNSSFTAAQWAAISSGITSGLVALIGTALQPSALNAYRTAAAQDVIDNAKEASTNKVTSLSASSTDTQYPSAKCVYDLIGDIESALAALR